MQIEVIPGAHHSPGVRCLDSAREALIGHRGQSSEVGEPTVTFCSTGPCREGLGHGFSHLYAERKMNLHFTRKSCYLHFFFQEHKKLEILNLLDLKYHVTLKMTKVIGMDFFQ